METSGISTLELEMMTENEHSLDFYVLKIFLTLHWTLDPSRKLRAQRIVPNSSIFHEYCMSGPVELSFPSPPTNYRPFVFTQSNLIGTVSHYFTGCGGKHIFSLRDLRQEYLTVKVIQTWIQTSYVFFIMFFMSVLKKEMGPGDNRSCVDLFDISVRLHLLAIGNAVILHGLL